MVPPRMPRFPQEIVGLIKGLLRDHGGCGSNPLILPLKKTPKGTFW